MPIVSSSYTIDAHAQGDGGHYVMESHTDNLGVVRRIQYHLPAGQGATEADALLAMHAANLDAQLAESEAEQLIGS